MWPGTDVDNDESGFEEERTSVDEEERDLTVILVPARAVGA